MQTRGIQGGGHHFPDRAGETFTGSVKIPYGDNQFWLMAGGQIRGFPAAYPPLWGTPPFQHCPMV